MKIFVSLTLFDGFATFYWTFFMDWRITLAFYKVKIRNSPISDICICLKPLQRCLWCPFNNPLVGNPATVLTKKKLKGEFKTSFTRCINSKKENFSKWFTFCFTFSFEWEIVVMSLTFFGVLLESCLVRRRKDEQGSHLSWNREILLRL